MRLEGNRLVDTWPEGMAPRQETVPHLDLYSMRLEDFNFDLSGVEIPTHELNEKEAAELANKLLLAMYNQQQKANPKKPRN